MSRVFSFVRGALMGGLVGAAAALLLAPASGEELRNRIESRVEEVRSEMEQAAEVRRAELEAQLADLRTSGRSKKIEIQV